MNKSITNYTKKVIVGLTLLCSHQAIIADEMQVYQLSDDMTLDSRISVGVQSMIADEYLHEPNIDHTVSQLIWDTDSLAMAGIGASFHFQERYTLNIDYWFSINNADSTLTDYDWMIAGFDGKNDWTDRSIHRDTDVSSASTFDISAELNTFQVSSTTFSMLIGYREDKAKRKAYGGEYIYSEEYFRDSVGTFKDGELGISYEQTWKSAYLGFKVNADITNVLTLNTRFIYAPAAKGRTVDTHHLRDIVGKTTLDDTTMYAIDIGFNYKISQLLTLNLNYMYQKYDTTEGDLKWYEGGQLEYLENYSRSNLETSLVSLSLNYTF